MRSRYPILGANCHGYGQAINQLKTGDQSSECSLYELTASLLVGIGSREQERLINLANAVALAVRYSSTRQGTKNADEPHAP